MPRWRSIPQPTPVLDFDVNQYVATVEIDSLPTYSRPYPDGHVLPGRGDATYGATGSAWCRRAGRRMGNTCRRRPRLTDEWINVWTLKSHYSLIMEQKCGDTGDQAYTDLNDWLAQCYLAPGDGKLLELEQKLKHLHAQVCSVLGAIGARRLEVYPEYALLGCISNMKLHLWQLGFSTDSFIRGHTAAYNVMMVMEKDIRDGGKTEKYPIEVVPFLTGKLPGQGVEAFSIMVTIGASVVTSAYLICLWVIEKGYFNGPFDDAEKARLWPLATIVRSIMDINCVYEAITDLQDAVFKSNKGKIEANMRPKPTILAYAHSYSRVATDILHQKKSRKSLKELVMHQVLQHNVQEKVRSNKSPRAAKPLCGPSE